jgi:anaerobic dimethyl sulfoxide reductase subunit C (anchor subunit)
MNVHDWALITFTILGQMSVGAFWVLGVMHTYALRKAGMQEADRLADRSLWAIFAVMVLALVASLFHLGNPLNAPRAITNVATSWLSREILFGVLFAALGWLFVLLQWRKIGSFRLRNILAIVAAVVGLGLVYVMSRVYMLPTQPAWDTFATPISFFATTFLLGSLAVGVGLVVNYASVQRRAPEAAPLQAELMRTGIRTIAIASIVLLGIVLITTPLQIAYLSGQGGVAAQSAASMFTAYGWLLGLRLALAFVGAGIFGVFLYQNALSAGHEKILANTAYAAFALVLVAEVLGRLLFYASHLRIGI